MHYSVFVHLFFCFNLITYNLTYFCNWYILWWWWWTWWWWWVVSFVITSWCWWCCCCYWMYINCTLLWVTIWETQSFCPLWQTSNHFICFDIQDFKLFSIYLINLKFCFSLEFQHNLTFKFPIFFYLKSLLFVVFHGISLN